MSSPATAPGHWWWATWASCRRECRSCPTPPSLYPRRFLSWLPLAFRVLTKSRRSDETITRMSGREVVVRTSTDAPRQLDGDLIAPGRELRATCIHGRLLVRVPR